MSFGQECTINFFEDIEQAIVLKDKRHETNLYIFTQNSRFFCLANSRKGTRVVGQI